MSVVRRRVALTGFLSAIGIAISGCGGGGGADNISKPPTKQFGTVNLGITRSTTSLVPSAAESAWVRLYNSGTTFSLAKQVAIPVPGSTTEVQFDVPVGTGYSVYVVAWKDNGDGSVEALAGGQADGVTVTQGQATQANINAAPFTGTLSGTDTLRSNTQATLSLNVSAGPTFLMPGTPPTTWERSLSPDMSNLVNDLAVGSYSFTVPPVAADTATYVRTWYRFFAGDWAPVDQKDRNVFIRIPSATLSQPPFRLPHLAPPPPTGAVVVTFDRQRAWGKPD